MRFMITFRIPMDKGNALAKDGKIGDTCSLYSKTLSSRQPTSQT